MAHEYSVAIHNYISEKIVIVEENKKRQKNIMISKANSFIKDNLKSCSKSGSI